MKKTDCCLHQQALAVKKMSEELKYVPNDCVKIINLIKLRPLNSRVCNLLFILYVHYCCTYTYVGYLIEKNLRLKR